jgi:hypothetical protein
MYTENRRQYSWPGSAFFPRFLGNRTPLLLFSVMWSRADILGLFSNNVVSFSRNLVLKSLLFSINVVRKWAMFLGQAIYVLGPLQLRKAGTRALLGAVISSPRGQAPQRSSA